MKTFLPLGYQVYKLAKILVAQFPEGFSLNAREQVPIGEELTPAVQSGATILNMNFREIDRFSLKTGASATIFVKRDNDFIRISTSVKKENGERAVGTALDHAHAGYENLLAGHSYTGFAQLFGHQHMTRYDPILDASGRIIAVLYVGINVSRRPQAGIAMKVSAAALCVTLPVFALYWWATTALVASLAAASVQNTPAQIAARLGYYGLAACAALLLGGVALHFMIRKMVARPLTLGTQAAQKLAKGDLTAHMHVDRRDEIGQMMQAINGISQGLAGIVGAVRSGSDHIGVAAHQIASGNSDLSTRAESQASSLEQISATMENLTVTVKGNAEHAREASALVATASAQATKGGEVVREVVTTMSAIKDSSRKVADIIGVIDSIAFQTNILALNASVEAARAGEQGRGFAVVATEVRQLAQRSADAAREIKSLIGASVGKVDDGSRLADEAGETMLRIVAAVGDVATIMHGIAAASTDQSNAIGEVSIAIGGIDEMTQQNAALVEQAAAATDSLRADAENLSENVRIFRLAQHARH
jgi:methyl-accepting chemotaxis protein